MELPVIVEYVTFRKEGGFAILAVNLNAYSSKYTKELEDEVASKCKRNAYNNFVVTIGMLEANENPVGGQYIFVGDFVNHPKFGDQFKAEFYFADEPKTEEGLKMFLMDKLPNIGDVRARNIIEKFGIDGTTEVLNNDIEQLLQINGITERRLPPIKEAWKKEKTLKELYMWLSDHGIEPALGRKMHEMWGSNALSILQENPYRLVEIKGIGFVRADNIAHKVLPKVNVPYRTKACMLFVLQQDLRKNSNLCIPYEVLKKTVLVLLSECDEANNLKSDIKKHLEYIPICIRNSLGEFVAVKDLQSDNGFRSYVYLTPIWEKEKYIAQAIFNYRKRSNGEEVCTEQDLKSAEEDVGIFSEKDVVLDNSQKEAVKSAFENKLTVITGPGGSGKSTICRCIFHLAQEKGLSVRMMSPTGKASQVLANKTGCGAATIHRSLGMMPGEEYPKEEIKEDIVIVDEVSMVGIDTMFAIMFAMEGNLWGNLIFVGDSNQLPSVSPGNFLSDIIKSNCANVVTLDKIHRQDENSYISVLANQISSGKVVTIPAEATDIKWHEANPDGFEELICKEIQKYLDSGKDMDDLQIMAPMYKGHCGVNKSNEAIQEMMMKINNTESNCLQKGFSKYYMYDRVIQTENNYDKQIFNGDMGKIVSLGEVVRKPEVSDKKESFITVNFYGEDKAYFGEEIEQLRLAWAITVHKYQGSQSPYIFFVMSSEARNMMTKELVYTAFTRAEKYLSVYGNTGMLQLAPTRSAIRKRYTNLNKLIREHSENCKLLQVLERKKTDANANDNS